MPKIQRKTVFAILFAVVSALAVASTAALCLVVHRIRQFDEANNCRVLAGMTPRDVLMAEAKPAAPAEKRETYVVQDGDDLISIAIRLGVSPSAIEEANGLEAGDALKPGMTLAIPGGEGGKASAKSAPAQRGAKKFAAATNEFARVHEIRFQRDEKRIAIKFTQKPTPEDVLRYVVVSPKVDDITVDTEEDYEYWRKRTWH